MRIIAIANFKGGTGKSTTSCNLAAGLSREGKRVLLIDADAQHNATDFFAVDTDGPTLTDLLEGTGESVWCDNVVSTERPGLWMVPADMRLLTLDLRAILYGQGDAYRRFTDFLDVIGQDDAYDYVLIDCPPSFTAASVAALGNADEVILPTLLDAFSLAGVRELIEQARSIRRMGAPLRFRVLVTMADRSRLTRQAEEALRGSGLEVFRTAIRAGVAVKESSYARQPLFEYAPQSRPAQDYEALLLEVLEDE